MDAQGNRLLEMFGDEAREQLGPLAAVQLKTRDVLEEPGTPALYCYFPLDTVISLTSVSDNGIGVEVGTVGREGMIGLAGILGTIEAATSAIVQIPGAAVRIPTAALKAVRFANLQARRTLDLYIEARFVQTAHSVACSRLHPVQSRLARWLLAVYDRIDHDEFVVAQEVIAELLGVHRPTVTTALQRIQEEGAIERRGRAIAIVDRSRLEALACECHRVLNLEFKRLFGTPGGVPEALVSTTARSTSMQSETATALAGMREIAGRLLLASIREQEARQEAEEANRAKDQFLAMVSHELRNPLNAILGWCAMWRDEAGVPAHGLDVIAANARAQLALVEDLLDAARLTSATLSVHPGQISLTDVVESAVNSVRPTAEVQQVRLRLTTGDDVPPITADADRLRQVLRNVLMNSLTFTDPGGVVDVQVGSTDGRAHVRIHDTGQGVAPDLLPRVFEHFRQGPVPHAARQGLGLGLSIARAIVELHGGTIAIDSPGVNQGTTCTIDLPVCGPTARQRRGA